MKLEINAQQALDMLGRAVVRLNNSLPHDVGFIREIGTYSITMILQCKTDVDVAFNALYELVDDTFEKEDADENS